ncbi:DNA polymerase III subunit delta' [Pseudoalteromonas sp. SSDWG2]|uniref:DNA polymerase III subunit delta' n=1 Tax=Pseudoalteromonas sp. SSDWG2 TaxID=3139391 RepID=UPI003BA8700E
MYPWLSPLLNQYALQHQQSRLHHAHLLHGAQGTGKRALAQSICEALLCEQPLNMQPCGECKGCKLNGAGTHPDLLVLSEEGSSIGVDAIRSVSDFIVHSAQQGGAKCVIVPNAHRMTVAASNALLKTLEEPNNHCYLWLLTDNISSLPATILSRCAKQQVSVADTSELNQWLSDNVGEAKAYHFAHMYHTQPLLLKSWQDNGELAQIQALYDAVYNDQMNTDEQKLVDILAQNSQYIAIFRLFMSQFLLQKSYQGLAYEQLTRCHAHLQHFSEHLVQTPGLNMTLALSQLMRGLKQELG